MYGKEDCLEYTMFHDQIWGNMVNYKLDGSVHEKNFTENKISGISAHYNPDGTKYEEKECKK